MTPSPVPTLVARGLFGLCIAALAWTPCSATATDTPALDRSEQAFVAKATADNAMQIALAQVALDRSSSPRVRALAQRIIDDHNALNEKLTDFSVAKKAHGQAHGMPNGYVVEDKKRLQNLEGDAFDKAFAGMMVTEHQKIIPLYERIAKTDDNPRLRQIAKDALPLLRGHLKGARALTAD